MKLSAMLAIVFAARTVAAQPLDTTASADDVHDQAVAAAIGFAGGGGWTPGGFHLDGAYLLRLDARDWFDIGLGFTIGGSSPACYADSSGGYTCNHGIAQGQAVGFAAGVRHYLTENLFLRA